VSTSFAGAPAGAAFGAAFGAGLATVLGAEVWATALKANPASTLRIHSFTVLSSSAFVVFAAACFVVAARPPLKAWIPEVYTHAMISWLRRPGNWATFGDTRQSPFAVVLNWMSLGRSEF
jgi:hypothetical protein